MVCGTYCSGHAAFEALGLNGGMEWQTKTVEQMQGESENRAEYREVMSSSLLQEHKYRK